MQPLDEKKKEKEEKKQSELVSLLGDFKQVDVCSVRVLVKLCDVFEWVDVIECVGACACCCCC